jgi:two-component system sensor histidine kinase KdpD
MMEGHGQLTTFLGTAPGVGKTYAMLVEARRRAASGQRVMVGWLEQHQRPDTIDQLGDLEMMAPAFVIYREHRFDEFDLAGALAAKPGAVVVDELAHSTPDGSRKRWMDVAQLIDAGIDVLTTVNVANLVSTRDYAARLTGAGAVESVPDELVRSGEVVLVDVPADALRRRITTGRVFSTEQVGGALAEYFRVSNLEALSQLGRAWMADSATQVGDDLLAQRGLAEPASRSVVIAGVSDSEWGEAVIRRATELACDEDADLLVVHARLADGSRRKNSRTLERHRELTEQMGGEYVEVEGDSPARALAAQADGRVVSRFVVARHRSRLGELARGSVAGQLRRLKPDIALEEVHQRSA